MYQRATRPTRLRSIGQLWTGKALFGPDVGASSTDDSTSGERHGDQLVSKAARWARQSDANPRDSPDDGAEV